MSEVDRAELCRLLDEATPRPWRQEWVEGDEWYAVYGQPTGDLVCPEVCTAGDADDTNLLVAAVNALPGLLDALEKAEAHRDSLAAALIEVQREKLALERAIERVRELHDGECCCPEGPTLNGRGHCPECNHEQPCPTMEAIGGKSDE